MKWRSILQVRLSTLLLVVTLCAVLFAWYADHYSHLRSEIVGSWTYPIPSIGLLGYHELLEIKRDGTFAKRQTYRTYYDEFSGTYTCKDDGTVVFHVTRKTHGTDFDFDLNVFHSERKLVRRGPEVSSVYATYILRCAVDRTGYLVMDDITFMSANANIGIRGWKTYQPYNDPSK